MASQNVNSIPADETRTREHLLAQFAFEKELASRLRNATKEERRKLYGPIYDEFDLWLSRFLDNPDVTGDDAQLSLQIQLLQPFLKSNSVFLEFGGGNLALSKHLANLGYRVFAVEAASGCLHDPTLPDNLRVIISGGPPYELADQSIDLIFSCHAIEHLHPDDVIDHLIEVRRLLVHGGSYICVTPNRLYGPHDISKYFDQVPSGLHLREYNYKDLGRLLLENGFVNVQVVRSIGRIPSLRSILPYQLFERLLDWLPTNLRRRVMDLISRHKPPPFRPLEQVIIKADNRLA